MASGVLTFTQSNGDSTDFSAVLGLTVIQVASNVAAATINATDFAGISVATLTPDMHIDAPVAAAVPAGGTVFAIVRFDTAGNGYMLRANETQWLIVRLDAGASTTLQGPTAYSGGAHTYSAEIVGQTFRAFIDGVQVGIDQAAPLFTNNTQFGLLMNRNAGTLTLDNLAYRDVGFVTPGPDRPGIGPGGLHSPIAWQWLQDFGTEAGVASTPLVVADLTVASSVENVALTQHNVLAVADLTAASTIGAVTLTPDLIVAGLTAASTIENVALTQHHTLVVANLTVASSVEAATLTQHNVLVVADLAIASTLGSVVLTQHHTLAVDGLVVASTIENVTLGVAGALAPANLTVASTIENVTLTQHHALVVADMTVATSVGAVTLTQHYVLAVADITVATTVGNTTLTQHHLLVVADLTVASTIGNVAWVVAGTGTGETFLARVGVTSTLVLATTATGIERPATATVLASPAPGSTLVAPRLVTEIVE